MQVRLSLAAMATRFELVLYGDVAIRLRAAGEEALGEIERLDAQLSFYRPDSEICWINSRAASAPVRVEPRLFRLLQRCADWHALTEGAFDLTVASARSAVGMRYVVLDEESCSVRFRRPGVAIDLGGYGKGYAIERAVRILEEHGVTSAYLHGGASSAAAIGENKENATGSATRSQDHC